MIFNSVQFFVFFPVVVIIYFLIPSRLKNIFLLLASYFFYSAWNRTYTILLLACTLITYTAALLIENEENNESNSPAIRRTFIFIISLLLCFGMLFYYKYCNFFLDSVNSILRFIGKKAAFAQIDLLLPVGISFYTFQAVGYVIDVRRKSIKAEHNFIDYALFVAFFPQLLAGPISRASKLLPQLKKHRSFDRNRFTEGVLLMIWGYFLKLVVADRISIFVTTVYGDIDTYAGLYIIIATLLYSVQIYCDFAGYSTIAIGAARILRINIPQNFKAPYLATSVADFWRNWHISLTSWFRDYLYIPLGGSKKGKIRQYINILVVFLISGLWHGAGFSFVIWGGLNGLYQILGDILSPVRASINRLLKLNPHAFSHGLLQKAVTFILISFSWIFFRSGNISNAFNIINKLFRVHNPWILVDGSLYKCGLNRPNVILMCICILVVLFADICEQTRIPIRKFILEQEYWFRCLFISLSIVFILVFGMWGPSYDASKFIYFMF